MILAKKQINRYLRQIIMPEISGPGQKRLLESSVFICGETVTNITPTVYYLAASGIGHIYCHLADYEGFEKLSTGIHDLNGDVSIELTDNCKGELRIFLVSPNFIISKRPMMLNCFIPTILCLYNGWRGGVEVFKEVERVNSFITKLSEQYVKSGVDSNIPDQDGKVLSTCFLGAISALELVKLLLDIGETVNSYLSFDLQTMEFVKADEEEFEPALSKICSLKPHEKPEVSLGDKKALIVGTGGLGSPAAYSLSLSGIGTIGLVDYDVVEISNLNRQILHSTSRIGMPKVESAAAFLENIHPHPNLIERFNTTLNKKNVFEMIGHYDLIIDAVDNFPTRFLLNDACFLADKPLLEAGVLRFDGMCMTMAHSSGPCYRCMLQGLPPQGSIPSCSESGVLGPISGILGFLQAAEAVKLLSGRGDILENRILFFNGLTSNFTIANLRKNTACPLCGLDPTIHDLQEYGPICRNGNR